jgi:Sulfotransferase family
VRARAGPAEGFQVTPWIDALGGFITRHQGLWTRIGNLETRLLADELSEVRIDRPIYVAGLARSGSTILLELLARHPDVVSHRYRDYPPVFTPYMWNRLLERTPQREVEPAERSHQDGIKVTPDSPEALEEVLWMAFFPQLHDPAHSAVLDRHTRHPAFESFYRDHIRKLLRVRGGRRYLAKGNYNVTRLGYLLEIFKGARFVIPVRDPRWHIASLIKQHALFCAGGEQNPKTVRHLQRVGHFEFGLDRRPVNAGDPATIEAVLACWQRGDEVEGWARYWSHVYGHVADRLEASPELRDAALVVRYEDLCRAPQATLQAVLDHVGLAVPEEVLAELAALLHFPGYYRPRFSADELALIDRLTEATAARFGYGAPAQAELSGSA